MPDRPTPGKDPRRPYGRGDRKYSQSAPALPGAEITSPEHPIGVVILPVSVPGSASNAGLREVMAGLRDRGFATVLAELLSPAETEHGYHNLDFDLLARRIADVTDKLRQEPSFEHLPIGYFGTSADAAAIATAAAQPDCPASAIVMCDARPELASSSLALIHAPTLFIVEDDDLALHLNRSALGRLSCPADLAVLRGTGKSLFSSKVASQAARLAGDWFEAHFRSREDD